MTRDEQIAQLKPGADVMVIGFVPGQCKFLRHVAGQVELLVRALNHTMSTEWVDEDALLFTVPPPAPKAIPGVRYRMDRPYSGDREIRIGTQSGLLWGPQYVTPVEVDFDPAVWIPLDTPEDAK